jgi:integrase/recombinase XerD
LEVEGVADAHHLNRDHLQRWQDTLLTEPISPKTRSVYLTAVRGLLRWASREDRVAPGLADWIDPVEVPEHEPLVLEPEQLAAIVAHYQTPRRDLVHLRDRALFWFLLTSSARINEVLQMDLADLDRTRWVVIQKGGGSKALVISTIARQWLRDYITARGRDAEPALWIYVGPLAGRRRLTAGDTNRIWRRLTGQLGIPPFTSRWLRGTSATELNELGATPIDVAQHLGHHGLATVMKYASLRQGRRQAMVDQLDALVPSPPAPAPGRRPPRRRRPA